MLRFGGGGAWARMGLWAAALVVCLGAAVVPDDADAGEGVPPIVEEGVNRRLSVQEGTKQYRISCPVSGRPKPIIMWKKDGEMIGAGWLRFRLQQDGRVLRIKGPRAEDSGQYVCEAVNGFGRRVVEFHLAVYGEQEEAPRPGEPLPADASVPPFFIRPADVHSLSAKPIERSRGDGAVDLPCHASGQPNPTIHWLKNGLPMRFEDSTGPQLKPNRWTLHIPSLREYHSGRYTCRVRNALGSLNATFHLLVSDAPATAPRFDRSHPLNSTVVQGQMAKFTCKVSSAEPPHIKWVKRVEDPGSVEDNSTLFTVKGMTLATLPYEAHLEVLPNQSYSSTLLMPNVRRRQSGTYICVVTNPAGHMVYKFAHLDVKPSPGIRPVEKVVPMQLIIGVSIAVVLLFVLGYALLLLHRFQKKAGSGASNASQSRPPPPSYPPPALPYKTVPDTPQRLTPSSGYYQNASAAASSHRYVPSRSGHLRSPAVVTPSSRDYQLYDASARVPLTQQQFDSLPSLHHTHQQPLHSLQRGRRYPSEAIPQPYELDFEESDGELFAPRHPLPLQPHPSLYSCR